MGWASWRPEGRRALEGLGWRHGGAALEGLGVGAMEGPEGQREGFGVGARAERALDGAWGGRHGGAGRAERAWEGSGFRV